MKIAFSPNFESRIEPKSLNFIKLSEEIQKLSDFYATSPGEPTPWRKGGVKEAYLAYFLPLNLVRLKSALHEVKRFLLDDEISEIFDFGSGSGATHFALEDDQEHFFSPKPFFCIELDDLAKEQHQSLIKQAPCRFTPQWTVRQPKPQALAVFSYSWLEMKSSIEVLTPFDHLLIVEPSTRECGRALMELRSELIRCGYSILAPCTHARECPLLVHSKKDWCHHRVHFAAPEWFAQIEQHLPMKNKTLTFSYLLASKTAAKKTLFRNSVRVIGDTLVENGKTKQLICRGEEREFLAWLHRQGKPPSIPRGAIIENLPESDKKAQEIRITQPLTWQE